MSAAGRRDEAGVAKADDELLEVGPGKVLLGGDSSAGDMSLDDSSLSTDADSMADESLLATGDGETAPAPEKEEETAPASVPAALLNEHASVAIVEHLDG